MLHKVYQGPSDACTAKTVSRDLSDTAKVAIVAKHNELRAKVARGEETNGPQPKASNMRKLVKTLVVLKIFKMLLKGLE